MSEEIAVSIGKLYNSIVNHNIAVYLACQSVMLKDNKSQFLNADGGPNYDAMFKEYLTALEWVERETAS